jgi:hypothetical protein
MTLLRHFIFRGKKIVHKWVFLDPKSARSRPNMPTLCPHFAHIFPTMCWQQACNVTAAGPFQPTTTVNPRVADFAA